MTLIGIRRPNRGRAAALICLCAGMLAACDFGAGTPTARPGNQDRATAGPSPAPTSTQESSMQPAVVDFKVYQDFMPMVPASGAPLHAFVTLEITGKSAPGDIVSGGQITITRPSGEVITTAGLVTDRQPDDRTLAQPGTRQVVLTMERTSISTKLTDGETLQGTATVTVGGRSYTLKLPQTKVVFTF
jgi:hypothetical protein